MAVYLGLLMFSFIVTCVAIVPYIDFYLNGTLPVRMKELVEFGDTKEFRKLHVLHNKKSD